MMPGSSRAYILELEQDKAMLQGALEAANEQNERLRKHADAYDRQIEVVQELETEVDRLRAELAELREEREETRWHAMGEDL
jgi:polyhydroxyalkanoate synthesis regulator phasin